MRILESFSRFEVRAQIKYWVYFKRLPFSSRLKPGTWKFTCGKRFIGFNFGIDDGAESKFGTHKDIIVLKILKYKYCVNQSRNMSREHFAKNRKLLTNWWPV